MKLKSIKKVIVLLSGLVLWILTIPPITVDAATNNTFGTAQLETKKEINYSDLSKEQAKHFTDKGFNKDDEYFTITTTQTNPTGSTRAVNVVVLTGSTKKVNNTMSRTEYIISSSRAPFTNLNARLSLGGKKTVDAKVKPYKGTYVYSGGIYATYTGKRQYLGYKLTVQYTTTWGSKTASASVGGLTIGK